MFNQFTFQGNLTKEVRFTAANDTHSAIANFTVAVNDFDKNKPAEFVSVTAWDKLAITCKDYLTKGSSVIVSGSAKAGYWIGNDDEIHAQIEVRAAQVTFLSSAKRDSEPSNSVPDDKKKAAIAKARAKGNTNAQPAPAKATAKAPANTDDSGFMQVDPADLPF